ncbi:manganese efflux pump MntP family protein [Maribellus sediminis]|uniref:manganese efflux pump MntP n=1 Tax=Maribellus sediminis TaxID=2696285 RepID=UPI001431EEAA|nr:manganese efflux pump MntP family protein [Maribellus sediminis]
MPLAMTVFQFITFLLIGLGLSFDSFAVSVSVGLLRRDIRFFQACKIAFSLAFFQGVFPVIGWMIGNVIEELISTIDHWIAFGLLFAIGGKMIYEGIKDENALTHLNPFKLTVLIGLSIATSIDAFVVGITFGFLETPIIFPAVVIGSVTFIASMLGLLFGKNIPAKRSHQSLILGGIILTLIGIKTLVEHLWF